MVQRLVSFAGEVTAVPCDPCIIEDIHMELLQVVHAVDDVLCCDNRNMCHVEVCGRIAAFHTGDFFSNLLCQVQQRPRLSSTRFTHHERPEILVVF